LLALASPRQVDLLMVWKLDRAFRSVVDGATTLQTLRQCGYGNPLAARALERYAAAGGRGTIQPKAG
jgi:hypothetical protein